MNGLQWVPFSHAEDERIYAKYFENAVDEWSYENNWALISQEARGGALRCQNSDFLLTAVRKHNDSPFVFVFSWWPSIEADLTGIRIAGMSLAQRTGCRVVLRKLLEPACRQLICKNIGVYLPPSTFQLQGDIPEDIFPQAIIDVRAVLDGRGSRFVKIRNHMKSFVSRQPLVRDLTPETSVEIEVLLQEWNRERQLRRATQPDDLEALSQIDASAYTVFANDFASRVDDNRYFSIVVEVETRPVGFAFAGRTAMHAAALYASISLTEYRGSAEFLLLKLLERLWTGGVRLLNLGGAETAGLHRFKTKFGVVGLRPTFDVELGL